jgi:hypothetical protein
MLRIDPRLRYLAARQTWPVYWQDFRVIGGSVEGPRTRLDFLGITGIGKSYLTHQTALALGERVPRMAKEKPVSDQWGEAFGDIYRDHFRFMASDSVAWEDKHRKTVHLNDVIGLERQIMRFHHDQIVINGVSVLRHRLSYFVEQAGMRPDFVSALLRDRLVVVCGSTDPVARSIAGKIKRGDRPFVPDEIRDTLAAKVSTLREAVGAIEALGVPVLDIDLDRPVPENIRRIASFMVEHGMVSPRIKRHAGKSSF